MVTSRKVSPFTSPTMVHPKIHFLDAPILLFTWFGNSTKPQGNGIYRFLRRVASDTFGSLLWQKDKVNAVLGFPKTMFKGSQISVSIVCESEEPFNVLVTWMLRRTPCANEFTNMADNENGYLRSLNRIFISEPYSEVQYMANEGEEIKCTPKETVVLKPYEGNKPIVWRAPQKAPPIAKNKTQATQKPAAERKKRETKTQPTAATQPAGKPSNNGTVKSVVDKAVVSPLENGTDSSKLDQHTVVKVWEDGIYVFIMKFHEQNSKHINLQVTVRMSLDNSYISAGDWPLLIFYGVMGLVYVFYGIFWLIMLACNWRDLLRVQFWISAVILLGMLEKAVFFAEYENVNKTGRSVHGAVIFAELVSCVKRTLARMLVIIVSLGYGIVKPRLGQTFHKVLIVGGIFFILASIEACLRAGADKAEQYRPQMIASIPLAVTEAIICWWIFTSLLQTIRTLRLRRNVVKLSLYRHFTNTLIFAVFASIAYMVWFLTQHRFSLCLTDWKELWMDEAFWHFLFSVILCIIMILWRPTINNQRYAFSPLLDAAEDDIDDDPTLSEAYDGMKMRSTKPQQRNGSPSVKDEQKAEDDLKWVEENIPSSIVDKVLPALDSDEEIMNTKFETSKME
ncbi:hypothetical protein RRG08_044728 [Elysia crispata]|uniref:Transmembrane protein 87A n=1 Tax=Elysia crispata TaxID=231223 RepID=A0AAE0ZHQ8_9GAST|nr:hypothetical protein RRG08_044728 [Elysia crispata]